MDRRRRVFLPRHVVPQGLEGGRGHGLQIGVRHVQVGAHALEHVRDPPKKHQFRRPGLHGISQFLLFLPALLFLLVLLQGVHAAGVGLRFLFFGFFCLAFGDGRLEAPAHGGHILEGVVAVHHEAHLVEAPQQAVHVVFVRGVHQSRKRDLHGRVEALGQTEIQQDRHRGVPIVGAGVARRHEHVPHVWIRVEGPAHVHLHGPGRAHPRQEPVSVDPISVQCRRIAYREPRAEVHHQHCLRRQRRSRHNRAYAVREQERPHLLHVHGLLPKIQLLPHLRAVLRRDRAEIELGFEISQYA
mmetsp:Transcript_10563/g.21085  ORF Transcript_10563/g.21085 Transcript_10563/m.21085 type:complete len:299 (-) Transcript_10563:928-1824(-)